MLRLIVYLFIYFIFPKIFDALNFFLYLYHFFKFLEFIYLNIDFLFQVTLFWLLNHLFSLFSPSFVDLAIVNFAVISILALGILNLNMLIH